MKKIVLIITMGILLIYSFSLKALDAKEETRIITPGDFFPEFSFPRTLSKQDEEYLGLPQKFLSWGKKDTFSLKDIKGDLIVLEYLNKYCFSCQLQAPIMNQVFSKVSSDMRLKDKVKFLGVGAGNNQREVESFREEKKVAFPIVPDPKFLAYEAIGDPGATPFTLFIRKTEAGLIVAQVKVGLTKEPEKILHEIDQAWQTDWNVLLKQKKDRGFEQTKAQKLFLPYTESEILKKVQEAMLHPEGKVLKVTKIELADGEGLFIGEIEQGKKKFYLFAKLVSRAPTCDICHATHFIFTFNEQGMILNFLPLQVTKKNNLPWDEKEIEQMKKRLVGRSILQPVDFDPQVDAISSATMTTALIVDSINKAKSIYEGLKNKGYIK